MQIIIQTRYGAVKSAKIVGKSAGEIADEILDVLKRGVDYSLESETSNGTKICIIPKEVFGTSLITVSDWKREIV